jgi:hypothetical protein
MYSEKVTKEIQKIISKFHILESSSYGLQAHNDGGIDDMSYRHEFYEMLPENFIVENDEVVGYTFEGKSCAFDGKTETVIYEWNNNDYSGWNDEIDEGRYKIVFKK